MFKLFLAFTVFLFSLNSLKAQTLKASCSEREKTNINGTDPTIIRTCFLKGFKFITTSYPDYAGRYFVAENKVFVKVSNKYVATTNTKVFNRRQAELLASINEKIQHDFAILKADADAKECLSDIDKLPKYRMNDLLISFNEDEIWFSVHWGLGGACRSVDGTVVSFKLKDIRKYLNQP